MLESVIRTWLVCWCISLGLYSWSITAAKFEKLRHHSDVIMSAVASLITNIIIVYSTVYSGANERKHRRPASLAIVRGIHRWPVNSPHKWPITRKMFPFDDVIMRLRMSHFGNVNWTPYGWYTHTMIPCWGSNCLLLCGVMQPYFLDRWNSPCLLV